MLDKLYNLEVSDFARFFGINPNQFSPEIIELIEKNNFSYKKLSIEKRDQVVLEIIKRIHSNTLSKAGKEGLDRWDKGWGENLEAFIKNDYNLEELVPKFIRPNQPVRLFQDYVIPQEMEFELNWYKIFRQWLFKTYLQEEKLVYEFGCGTGFNLIELAQLFPEKKLYGLDWAKPSQEIIRLAAREYSLNIKGIHFDMFNPDETLVIKEKSAFLAIGALEQLGQNYEPFLQYALQKKPSVFIHVDSLIELYDEHNLPDYLAIIFDRQRNYLDGYLTHLRELEQAGKIEIIKTQRMFFGSLFHDGYSFIIWRPKQI